MKQLLLLCMLLPFLTGTVRAQFEGEINYRAYEPGNLFQARYMDLHITPQRILMESPDTYHVLQGLRTNALLVRHDQRDFIFKTSESEGVRVTRDDIDGLKALLMRFSGSQGGAGNGSPDWSRVEETGETESILSYETHQFIIRESGEDAYTSVWLTDGIKVNWGIVRDVWHETIASLLESDLPIEVFMNRNSFPLRVEYYKENELQTVIEATSVSRDNVERSLLEVPREMRLVGFGELMMRIMRERTFGQ